MTCVEMRLDLHPPTAGFDGSFADDWCSDPDVWATSTADDGNDSPCSFVACDDQSAQPSYFDCIDTPDSPPTVAPSSPTAKDRIDGISVCAHASGCFVKPVSVPVLFQSARSCSAWM